MADKIPAVPSLSNLSRPLLTSKENVCLYLIQFLFANPGETVSHHEGEMISFRKLVAKHGHIDPADLAQQIGDMLTTSISHYFPNAGIQAHCTIDEETGYDNGIYQGNYGVAIAIEMHRYDEIMAEKSSDIDYARRQVIIDFVENFRPAYNRKDLKLLTSVFSDKALIITGKLVSEKPNSDIDRLTLNNNKVVYIKQTKQEYLRNLSNVFKTSKFINVKFEDIDVVQHPKYDDIYGVTLKQYWHTNRYKDEGYLFLMIDFRDANNPLIQVRTWQPYKNKQGQVITKMSDVYHLGSFRIVR